MNNDDDEGFEGNERLMRRLRFVKNHEELGKDLALVNEGVNYREMDPYYYGVTYGDDGSVKAQKLSNKEVFTKVHGNSENEYRKFMREAESAGVDGFDVPKGDVDWMKGVLNELPPEKEFMLEFEYLLGETAVATKQVKDTPELREEWVFNYSPEYVVLTGKLEFRDRFSDEAWEAVSKFTGEMVCEEQEIEGMEGIEQTVLDGFSYESLGVDEREPEMLQEDSEVLKTAVEGFLDRSYSAGDSVRGQVQVVPGNSDVFRVWFEDVDMFYYVFQPVPDVGLDFRMPEWAVQIFDEDSYI